VEDPVRIVLMLVPMILSLTFHEFAHAQVATWLGDDTPRREGRLTLNPMAHVDLWGTIIIPAFGAFTNVPLIGWAKPVHVNPARFRRGVNMRRGFTLVAAAGPLSNLFLAIVCALVLRFGGAAVLHNPGLRMLLSSMFLMNLGLCVFNLLPIAPLDGSRLTPRSMDEFQEKVAPYAPFILMGILMIPPAREWLISRPVMFLAQLILRVLGAS
jgi:Zn-dependent protease